MMLLSIIALYNYQSNILDGIRSYLPVRPTIPEHETDFEPIDFEILKNTILLRAGELSLVYSDPDLFKLSLAIWSAKNRLEWQNLYNTLYLKYDPLFSKIREYALRRATTLNSEITETETDTTKDDTTKTETENQNRDISVSAADSTVDTISGRSDGSAGETDNGSSTLYVQAFNDIGVGQWHEKEKTVNSDGKNSSSTLTNSSTENIGVDRHSQTDDNMIKSLNDLINRNIKSELEKLYSRADTGTLNDIITETVRGQRPYQELIKLQREIVQFNLYDFIANEFVRDFCVLIY